MNARPDPNFLARRITQPRYRGVGLSLAIVRDVAACHGGQLILENRTEGGLRASLVLPRSRA